MPTGLRKALQGTMQRSVTAPVTLNNPTPFMASSAELGHVAPIAEYKVGGAATHGAGTGTMKGSDLRLSMIHANSPLSPR
jgi:hypothetical protein